MTASTAQQGHPDPRTPPDPATALSAGDRALIRRAASDAVVAMAYPVLRAVLSTGRGPVR